MEIVAEKLTGDCLVISRKLSAEQKLSVFKGDWFEACHSFKSTGTYKGDFEITDNMILDFVANFKAGVVRRWITTEGGFRLRSDIEHWGPFAGWIVDCMADEKKLSTGETVKMLMLKCNLSADAVTAIKTQGKEYFSIEYFADNPPYTDDQTGKVTANVLTGGAFTDSPFCQEVAPMKMSILKQKQDEQAALSKAQADTQNQKKEELSKMKTIVATLGVAGIQLSSEASPEVINKAILSLAEGKKDAEQKLSTKEAELITAKKALSDKEDEVKTMKDAQAAEVKKARETKLSALKEEAVKLGKLSPAEVAETDPAKQHVFVKQLSLDDLSFAEGTLALMAKKVEVKGVSGGAPEGQLSAEEVIVASARAKMEAAREKGQKLSYMEAFEKAKAEASKADKGGK